MKIGALTAPWAGEPLEKVLDFLAEAGCQTVELGTGNYPPDAHCNFSELKGDPIPLVTALKRRALVLSALSCHGNPIHPNPTMAKAHHEVFRSTVRLAAAIQQMTGWDVAVNGFSGLPGGCATDKTPNWVVAPWPDDHLQALEYQWGVAVEYWQKEHAFLEEHGVNMCFEMHPNFLVYNPRTLIKLRDACGPRICCNFDPSHLGWQGIDPCAAIRWLAAKGDVIKHVHAKDVMIYDWNARIHGVLDTTPYGEEAARAWIFRTVGYGHGAEFWADMISTLRMVGYDGALSIEHEDSLMSSNEGFLKAVALLKQAAIFEAPTAMTWA